MKKRLLLIVFLLFSLALYSVEFFGKKVYWDPGLPKGIPQYEQKAMVTDFGARGDGKTDDSGAFQNAINTLSPPAVLWIPQGKYMLKNKLKLRSGIVLRGAGHQDTLLLIDHNQNAIEAVIYKRGKWTKLLSGFEKGSTSLKVVDVSLFKIGYAEIEQENDPAIMYTDSAWNVSWGKNSQGQILRITSISENTLILAEPLNISYNAKLNPQIRSQGLIENFGIEDLGIKRMDKSDTSIFYFKNAALGWIKNVHSMLARKSHLASDTCYRLEIRDSFFDDATDWGGGGHGYGVSLNRHSTSCLIENNIFKHLRHSMLLQLGANGNVFAYNYSIENWQPSPGWTPCDISLHGHWPYANLFESNIVQEIDYADHWGPCGPDNTTFRNRVESEGIDVLDHSHHQIIIGNEIIKDQVNILEGTDPNLVFTHMNLYKGKLHKRPDYPTLLGDSLYLKAKPDFYKNKIWPSLGADLPGGILPAKIRYEEEFLDKQILGDVDANGRLDIIDALLIAQFYVGLNPAGFMTDTADVDNNGKINIIDALIVAQYYVGLI